MTARAAKSPARDEKLMRKHELALRQKIETQLRAAAKRIALKIARELHLPEEKEIARS
jgi:hypothetical protein